MTSVSVRRGMPRSQLAPGNWGAVIWSKDADFAERARRTVHLQVVWVRLGNTTNAALRARLAPHLPAIAAALEAGEALIEVR